MTKLAREKFPLRKISDTVKIRVPDLDRGRCDSRNILRVIIEVDLTKDLYKIGTKEAKLCECVVHFVGLALKGLTSRTFHHLMFH